MNTCKNCNEPLTGKYCSACGQPSQVKRIDGHYIVHEIEHVLHVERGILFTIRELILRLGKAIQQFISEDRGRLVKPVIFVLVTALLCTFTASISNFESEASAQRELDKSTYNVLLLWLNKYLAYENILIGAFIAIWITMFFRKHRYNFFEILILMCFVQGIVLIFVSLFQILQGVTQTHLLGVMSVIAIGYSSWAIGQFFGENKLINYIKSLLAYLLGVVSFFSCLVIIATLIDLLKKH